MSMTKTFWAGVAGGALLLGSAFGAAWYAACQPRCVVSRALEGASHASAQLSPISGLGPVLARVRQADSLAKNEIDLGGGLPDEPTPDGDPAPIVIPDGTPPAMPPTDGEEAALPMPRLVDGDDGEEQEVPACGFLDSLQQLFLRFFMLPAQPESTPEPFPEAELPADGTTEMREDPHRHHHHNGCPYPGSGFRRPCPRIEKPSGGAVEPEVEGCPMPPNFDTLELRESDGQFRGRGPV